MISTIAIVVAGVSLIIVVVTIYRQGPNEPFDPNNIERGANGMVEIQTTPTIECQTQEVAIVDSKLNLIV